MTAENIKAAGCDVEALKREKLAGVSATSIRQNAGCSASALKEAGFTEASLANAGFTPKEISDALVGKRPAQSDSLKDADIKAAGCDPVKLQALFKQGVSAQRIHVLNGCSVDALKKAGYDPKALANAGFTTAELLAAGMTPAELKQAGIIPSSVIADGRKADCSVVSLKAARASGVSVTTIKETMGCSAADMAKAGYSAAELKKAGFTAAELKDAGFSTPDLIAAGFNAKELAAAGVSAKELKRAGFTAKQLLDAGFSPSALKKAGFNTSELKDAGIDAETLSKAGVSLDELKKAGFTSKALRDAGLELNITPLTGANPNIQTVSSTPAIPPLSTQSAQAAAEAAHTKQLQDILKRQQTVMADQRHQQVIQQRTGAMLSAATQAIQDWKTPATQAYVAGSELKEKVVVAGSKEAAERDVLQAEAALGSVSKLHGVIKAGDILFAVIDTSVNSDEPGPILATIVSGKLKGSKLIGSFVLAPNANKMSITFSTLSVPGVDKTISVNAFAIEPDTARTALSSKTDHHYLLRYGSLFASTFVQGFGNAFQSANTTITIGGSGGALQNTTITNGVGRSTLENAVIGMATLGKAWSQVAQQQFARPTTVEVYSGTAIGVLFTQDLRGML